MKHKNKETQSAIAEHSLRSNYKENALNDTSSFHYNRNLRVTTWRWLGFITDSIAFFINLLRAAVTAGPPDTPHRLDPRVKVQPATLTARRRFLAGEQQERPLLFFRAECVVGWIHGRLATVTFVVLK